MADSELQDLTADTAPASGDVVYVVVDPAGTPLARKMTVDNLLKAINILSADTTPDTADVMVTIDDPSGTPAAKKVTVTNLVQVLNKVNVRHVCIEVVDKDTALTTGDGKKAIHIPPDITGYNLVYVHAFCLTASTSGIPAIQVRNQTDTQDMLSTKLTIDANETDSKDAAAPAVIDTTKDDVVTNDIIAIDCDVAGTGTKGLYVTLGFQKP